MPNTLFTAATAKAVDTTPLTESLDEQPAYTKATGSENLSSAIFAPASSATSTSPLIAAKPAAKPNAAIEVLKGCGLAVVAAIYCCCCGL